MPNGPNFDIVSRFGHLFTPSLPNLNEAKAKRRLNPEPTSTTPWPKIGDPVDATALQLAARKRLGEALRQLEGRGADGM